MALKRSLGSWWRATRRGTRTALANRAEEEGWHVVEQVRVEEGPIDLVLSKSVVVLLRISSVPATEGARRELEAAAERLGCVGLLLDTEGPGACPAPLGRVMVARPRAVERVVSGEVSLTELLASFGLGL